MLARTPRPWWTCLITLIALGSSPALPFPEGFRLAPNEGTYASDVDPLTVVNRAPGAPENSIFAAFSNNESVSLYNGNLLVTHASSPSYPLGDGSSLGLVRSYSSKNVYHTVISWHEVLDPSDPETLLRHAVFVGRSWVGSGWKMHLGRLFRKPVAQWGLPPYAGKFHFEDPQGTEISLEEEPLSAHPVLRWGYVNEAGHFDCSTFCEGVPGICHECPAECGDPPGPECMPCYIEDHDCDWMTDIPGHYEVTYPDGTNYFLEQIVDEETMGERGWISNADRNGWYATKITDVHGNVIRVVYWGVTENSAHPEAIKEIWIDLAADGAGNDPTERRVIWTEFWWSTDPNFVPGTQGTLRSLHAVSFNDTEVTYNFFYDTVPTWTRVANHDEAIVDVPVLRRVELPAIGGSPAGVVEYEYTSLGGAWYPHWVLGTLHYPTGGVSLYGYAGYVAGRRDGECWFDVPNNNGPYEDQCHHYHYRREAGVAVRRLYPEGLPSSPGERKPVATWQWDRTFWAETCSGSEVTNDFRMIQPDGRVVQSTFYGEVCGGDFWTTADGPDGWEATQTTFNGRWTYDENDVPIVPPRLRTEQSEYSYWVRTNSSRLTASQVMLQKKTTTFLDDDGTCFYDGAPIETGNRTLIVENNQRDDYNHWKVNRVYGNTLKNSRIAYTAYTASACQLGKHVLNTFDFKLVEEGSDRVETDYDFDCEGDLELFRANPSIRPSSPAPTEGWSSWEPNPLAGPSPDDSTHDREYFANGNLKRVTYSGSSPLSNTYAVNYTWNNGVVETARLDGLAYDSRQLQTDPAGFVAASLDPNGLQTDFDYDALGRVTRIDPPGTTELSTRIVYPSLNETRVIQSPGIETDFIAGDATQFFSKQMVDGLGRSIESWKALPEGLSVQVTRYDEADRVIFQSEWMPETDYDNATKQEWGGLDNDGDGNADYYVKVPLKNGVPWGTVTFYGEPDPAAAGNPLRAIPDGLGRVRRIERADGSVVEKDYCGPHERVTTQVETLSGSTASTTKYYKDGHGRLVMVDAPEGADAVYQYDLNDNLLQVNLTTGIENLATPFLAWKNGTNIQTGQVRTSVYDALERLKNSTNPENGTTTIHSYDVWGKALESTDALGAVRGYFFKSTYDLAGRLTKTEKIAGTPGNSATTDVNALGGDGSFESAGVWEKGYVKNGNFDLVDGGNEESFWFETDYSSLACIESPGETGNSRGLKLGTGCSYNDVTDKVQLIRRLVTVGREDALTFKYWRQVREGTQNKDKFSVFVVNAADGVNLGGARYLFSLDDGHFNYARWRQTHAMRPGDLFTETEWAEGATQNLYLYFAFEKGDSASSGLGAGIMIDDVVLGHPAAETLAELVYDSDACSGSDPATEVCIGEESTNGWKGQLAHEISYQSDREVAEKSFAYHGLNGRLSGVRHRIDWEGVGSSREFSTRATYEEHGLPRHWFAPSAPGEFEEDRPYETMYARGMLTTVRKAFSTADPILGGFGSEPGVEYDAAGVVTKLRFPGSTTTIGRDVMSRPKSYRVEGQTTFWESGDYTFDPAGNITAIGDSEYRYDLAGRLVTASVWPQATNPYAEHAYDVGYSYDAYGNMLERSWSYNGSGVGAPMAMAMTHTYASGGVNRNRIEDPDFAYDRNGNTTRLIGSIEEQATATWDSRNRMTSFYEGQPGVGAHTPSEFYVYDANGYRIVRIPVGDTGDGQPHIYIRDGSGQLLSEFVERPVLLSAQLEKDFIYAVGQLVAEVRPIRVLPDLAAAASLFSGGQYAFKIKDPTFDSYTVDIRTESGFVNRMEGAVPDAQDMIWISESELVLDETMYIRVRGESGEVEMFSDPVSMTIDSSVTSQSANQVRAMSASHTDTGIGLSWSLFDDNGERTYLYFDRGDGGGLVNLTPLGLPPGSTFYAIASEALASPTGSFLAAQAAVQIFGTCMPTLQAWDPFATAMPVGSGCVPFPPPPVPPDYVFAASFHHRDHLGNLRVVTDQSGWKISDHDYYPFGMEMVPPGETTLGGSRKRFTGHERDEQTGLDYAMARYCGASLARFLSVDPVFSSPNVPLAWNRYSYVLNNPLGNIDPTGEVVIPSHNDVSYGVTGRRLSALPGQFKFNGFASETRYELQVRNIGQSVKIMPTSSGKFVATASVTSAEVHVSTTTETPQWTNAGRASATAQAEWNRFVGAVKTHEEGHVGRTQNAASGLDTSVAGVTGTGSGPTRQAAIDAATANVTSQVASLQSQAGQQIDQQNQQYDSAPPAGTNHGETQGAVLNDQIK